MSETSRPPYWGPPPPPYFAPPSPQPTPRPRGRWLPGFVGGVALGAVIAAAVTAALTAQPTGPDSVAVAPVTVTATPSAPPSPPPRPMPTTAEADRQTCQTYDDIGDTLIVATDALQVIPADMTILAPEVRANPAWSAAVQRAADLYGQAATRQADGIAPGSTPALGQAANALSHSLQTMSTAYRTYDAAVGNIYAAGKASASAMSVLCDRLAPR